MQEASISTTFGRHAHIRIKMAYLDSFRQELSIGICMGPIRGGGGGRVRIFGVGSPQIFWATPTKL